MSYDIAATNHVFNDHNALRHLLERCGRPGTRAILVGFGETAKHLINLCRQNVAAVYDPDKLLRDVRFRGVPVIDLDRKVEANVILCCKYSLHYEYFGKVIRAYNWMEFYYPPTLDHKPTYEIKPFEQEEFYKVVLRDLERAPLSMMSDEKMKFLLELLRLGLTFPGEVIELGCWQGGSTWLMARALAYLGEARKLYLMDLFEEHSMDPWATMCTDEVIARMGEQYANIKAIVGLVDDERNLRKTDGCSFCFAHVDLGYQEPSLAYIWDHLTPGAPLLLDNYGHIAAPTWKWDDFFASRGTRVTRLPWTEQGLVFKPPTG